MHGSRFARHALDEHANGHSTRESVWVDNDIRLNATFAEGHIDGRPFLRADSFLTMPRGELISNHR